MIRHVLAAVCLVALIPSSAATQATVFTINAASADVHKSPTVASPVIGRVLRGRTVEVTREVGDWVKVSWPEAPDGFGYVRLTMGSFASAAAAAPNRVAGSGAVRPATGPGPRSTSDVRAEVAAVERSTCGCEPPAAEYVTPRTHRIGVGGLMNGSTIGFGAGGRAWLHNRFGGQIELSRYSLTSPSIGGRVTSIQVAPSLLYSLPNRVTDYVWVRPYLGVGARLSRSTLSTGPTAVSISQNRKAWQAFGGGELTIAGAPQFSLSADLRYDSSRTPFTGFDFGGVGFSVSGHWYVK